MSDSFITSKKFFDNKNFPRGFSRQGDFTIREANILEKSGVAFQKLTSGEVSPSTKLEESFVAVINGKQAPDTEYEKVWMKYLALVNSTKKFHTLSGGRPQLDNVEDYVELED